MLFTDIQDSTGGRLRNALDLGQYSLGGLQNRCKRTAGTAALTSLSPIFSALRELRRNYPFVQPIRITVTNDGMSKWKTKSKSSGDEKLIALNQSIAKRKKNIAQLKKDARAHAVFEAMREECVRAAERDRKKYDAQLLKKYGW